MELNFSKKTRKIVASLLAVAILLGVLPVSGLTGNSSGAESSSSENSTKTIYVNSTKQPILFDSVGNFKEIIPKVKKNIYSTEAENGDKIALFTDIGNGNSVVFYKTTEWTPSAYMWKEDSSENPDKNAAWPGEAMKKYGDSNSSLYYYVYGSAKGFDKVIFNDGNDQNGDQTDNKDLKAWNVYTKTSAGRPICDSLTKCDVSDNFNVYEYADSKLSGKNISAPQGMGATIEIAGTKYTVCGDGAKSEITCYEDDKITSLTANTVDGYTAKVTNSVVGDNQITYSVTYTNKTYGMQFSVENTVTFIKNPRLVLEGKWTVTFNGKKYENGDTICNQKDSVKNLEAAFKIDSVTFNGKEISGYDAKTTLNGNSFDSSCGSNELEKENKLVATVYYEADNGKKYSAKSEFSFKYSEGDVTLSENEDGDTVYFDGNNIYTNSDSVTLTLNDESKIEDLTLELYKGDSTPYSKNKIENAIEFDHEKGTITIGNKDVKLSEIKRATLTITSSKYNLSKTYTISYDTISKDNLKYSNTNENNERYYVNAEKGVTVTFNLVEIDKKLFNDENAEVTCDKENGVKISFNKDNKEWKATITKSADYTFTFSNNGFVQTVKITKQDLYLDDKAPKIKSFKIENGSSDSDKLLSFLTFGIYHNNVIKVTVNAEDEDISSGIKDIVLYDGKNAIEGAACKVEGNKASRIFTLDCGENEFKQYMLTAKVVDNVLYESESYTFEKPEKAEDLYSKELTAKISAADIEIVTNTIKPDVTSITSNAYGDNSVKYTDSENREWYSNNIQFNISADDSEVANHHTGIKSVTATFNGTDVSKKLKGLPVFTAEKVESVNDITFNTEGLNLNEGTNTVEVTVVNNSGMSSTKKYEVYVDTIKPEVSQFEFKTVKSDVDKILSFLTFGIYNNEKIQVTVSAYDVNNAENAKSGIDYLEENHAEIQLYNGGEKIAADDNSYSYDENGVLSRTFTLACGENEFKQYMLTAKAWDNVHNESVSYTFEKPDKAEDLYSKGLKAKQSDSADTEVVTNTIAPIVTEIKSNAYGESSVKYTDEYGKEWYSNGVEFHIYAKDSSDNKHHTGIKSVTAKFNDEEVTLSGLPTFTDKKFESVSNITFNTKVKSGENKVEVTVMNNSGVSSTKTYVVYGDITPPEVENFSFSRSETEADKLLSFLTFGIYSNDKIKVTVTAKDPAEDEKGNKTVYGIGNYSEKNHAEIQLYSAENQGKITAGDYNYKDGILSRTFTLDCRENEFKQYMLTAKAWDNVHNESVSYTFEKPETAEFIKNKTTKTFTAIQAEGVKITEVVTNTIAPIVTEIKSNAYGESSVKYTDEYGKEWYSNGVEFHIYAKDSSDNKHHTGIKSVTATFNGTDVSKKLKGLPVFTAEKVESVNDITFNTEGLNLNEGTNTVEVTVVNNSGMSSTKEYKVYVDKIAPEITSFDIQNNDKQKIVDLTPEKQHYNYYFQTDTQVTVNADDNAEDKGNYSGIKTIYFRAYDVVTGEEYKSSKNVSTDNDTASATFTVKANFKGELYAYAVDNVDNNGKTQHGEKKPDDLIVETQQHHNGNASVTMSRAKASYKDNSGLDLYSGNVNARVVFEDTYAGIKDATITVYDYTNAVTGTIYAEIGNDGSIEKTEVTGSVNNIIFNDDYTTSKDNLLPKLVIDYVVTNNSNNIKITTSMTDRAGNKTDNVKDSLSIDKTKPVIDVKYDNNEHTTYGGNDYYKADRTATVTVTERNFDESLVEAAIMRNGGRYTTIGGWTHNNNTADPDKSTHVAKIVYNTDGDFTFDIAVKDKAMNSADKFTQQKFTVDKTAPVIDVSFDNNSAKNGNYYKADRTATIKITEHNFNSGSQYVNIPVTAEGTTAPSVVGWSGSGDDHNATVSFNKDGKYSFTVDYTDLAGNKAVQKKVDSFYIDKTAPEVEITGVADHQAYNGTVAPVVTYRDDNFTDDHDFKFTRIDINSKSDDTSKFDYDTDGNGVTEFIYKYRDFAEVLENDGIYNFTVELSDKAGNSTSKSVTFSVNRFGSTFKASDESEKLIKNGYTNAEQDIVVEEINVSPLTKHSVTLAKSGGNSTELVENTDYTFTSSNNGNEWCKSVYTVNKKNFSDEAAYTVTIMSVDKAKNTNNNRMADSSLSTEQKNKRECAISFVVDKTSPLVSITGIKDNELYKEASKKVKIVCEDDNLDKSKLFVTLDNKKLAEGEDYTIVDDKDGSIAGMLTAEIVLKAETGGIKENLKVTIGDLAGNTGEKSVDNFILSANIFQRFFANPVLVICTFAGLALVIAAVIFFVAKKRKKAE
ncbi:MAG: starch-binding protein [Ruminococcus sp.]